MSPSVPAATAATLVDDLRAQIGRMQGRPSVLSMPTHPALEGLISLQPGGSYSVDSTSLALLLMAGPSRDGAWCAMVGTERVGFEAAAAVGVDLDRTVWVPDAGADPASVLGALVDAVGVVMVDRVTLPEREVVRLRARLHRRQGVLIAVGDWPRVDARLRLRDAAWTGLQDGHGHLVARQATVEVERGGRVAGSRRLWFPGRELQVAPVGGSAVEHAARRAPIVQVAG
ncbi:hypothetical protein [Aeromicrobium duanguangcaii]|uniref:Protein ImuA n=1 Tax=Aeromicrobium duanguangcaii TaxID=2968086 RepID=A0ABY5KAZ9_9ACTN|nr:hypothetical protein [Aeromicrobium duanguangcaii]MCD9154973.1 hypothetical protein [Aeromicrobium duanguangcaii]MCL3838987.1 hypothetical protein [Aeromicrobium duanguangcaii]UUI67622.1 hypothetical protein NP095_10450 [Aeromicrobium duanguangcaii]